MENKCILKFLTALISIIIVSSSNGLIFATSTRTDVEGTKQNENSKGEEFKPLTEEEWEKEQKKEYEIWQQNMKVEEKKEKEFLEQNIERYKNFKKEDYEDSNYDLIVYFKNKVPILYYVHKITKTKIVLIFIDNLENLSLKDGLLDEYYFKAFTPDDKGLVHFTEHCIVSNIIRNHSLKDENQLSRFNANTKDKSLSVVLNERKCSKNFIKNLFMALRSPEMLKKDGIFKLEKERILFEMIEDQKQLELVDSKKKEKEKFFNYGGDPQEIKKITKEEIIQFFKNTIHPSNLLIIKYVELNKKEIKDYLKILHEEYLSHFNFKEIKIPSFKRKINYDYLKEEYVDDLYGGTVCDSLLNKKESKYWAFINLLDSNYDKEDFKTLKKNPALTFASFKKDGISRIPLELDEFVKKLGYEAIIIKNLAGIYLYGNKKELFKKEALQKAYKKIYNFILEKIKTFTEKDIERNFVQPFHYNKMRNEKAESFKNFFTNPICYNHRIDNLKKYLQFSFSMFDDVFSKELFTITKDNEIIDSKESNVKKIKENITSLGGLENKKPFSILVKEQGKPINNTEKHKKLLLEFNKPYYLPIEFKKNSDNVVLNILCKNFLVSGLISKITCEKITSHSCPFATTDFIGSYVAVNSAPTKEYKKKELAYYENKNFEKDLKDLKITKKDFEDLINKIKEEWKNYDEIFKSNNEYLNRITKSVDYYLEHGPDEKAEVYDEKKGGFKIDDKTTRNELFIVIVEMPTRFKSLEEKMKLQKAVTDFIKKYGQNEAEKEYKSILIDKDFVKELKEKILIPSTKAFYASNEIIKELLKEIDNVKFKDFLETVKSCGLVPKEKFEKDQKIADDFREQTIFLMV